jgi:uncharacterized SAM-binding protein YcdF (DUF218 family)
MMVSLVHILLLPPAGLFLLLIFGLLLGLRYPKTGRALSAGAVLLLFVLSTGVGARMLVTPLEQLTRALPTTQGIGAEAIVVLAAGRYANAPEYGGAEVPDYIALARLRYAAHLYRKTELPLLVSGGNGTAEGLYKPKAWAMATALRHDFSVPVRWIESASATTAENALFSAKMLKRDNVSRILLVTDAMHMPRSVMAFAENGMEVIPAPTVFFSNGELTWRDFLPSAEHLRRSYYATYEWLGLIWYSMRYVDK